MKSAHTFVSDKHIVAMSKPSQPNKACTHGLVDATPPIGRSVTSYHICLHLDYRTNRPSLVEWSICTRHEVSPCGRSLASSFETPFVEGIL